MKNKYTVQILGMIVVLAALVYISYVGFIKKDTDDIAGDKNNVICTMDAKECPDGSFVGRTGPNCQFVCPASNTKPVNTPPSSAVTPKGPVTFSLKINQSATPLTEKITVLSIVEDSRCPVDVQCIQAGTVRVQVKFESSKGTSTQVINLGEFANTKTETFWFLSVLPAKNSKRAIQNSDYKFTFKAVKR